MCRSVTLYPRHFIAFFSAFKLCYSFTNLWLLRFPSVGAHVTTVVLLTLSLICAEPATPRGLTVILLFTTVVVTVIALVAVNWRVPFHNNLCCCGANAYSCSASVEVLPVKIVAVLDVARIP